MQILKHGDNYYAHNSDNICRCKNCSCEFQYNFGDCYKKHYVDLKNSIKLSYIDVVNCPECDTVNVCPKGEE